MVVVRVGGVVIGLDHVTPDPHPANEQIWALGLWCETPPASHDNPRTPNVHI